MPELAARPHATEDIAERARPQDNLQRADSAIESLPFDADAARADGRAYAAVASLGRRERGTRAVDRIIPDTARAAQHPLFTSNPEDPRGLDKLIEIVTDWKESD